MVPSQICKLLFPTNKKAAGTQSPFYMCRNSLLVGPQRSPFSRAPPLFWAHFHGSTSGKIRSAPSRISASAAKQSSTQQNTFRLSPQRCPCFDSHRLIQDTYTTSSKTASYPKPRFALDACHEKCPRKTRGIKKANST